MKRNVLLDCTVAKGRVFGARIAVARMSFAMMSLLLALLLGLMLGPGLCAQQQPNVDKGVKMYGSYDGSEIDTVNLQNGNLMLHIAPPLSYPQRGKLDSHMLLSITSKNWTVGSDGTSQFWHLGASPARGVAVICRGVWGCHAPCFNLDHG